MLHKKNRSTAEKILVSQEYPRYNKSLQFEDYVDFLYYDSLYSIYENSAYSKIDSKQLMKKLEYKRTNNSQIKYAINNLTESLEQDSNNYQLLFYASYFCKKFMNDSIKAEVYYNRLKQIYFPDDWLFDI